MFCNEMTPVARPPTARGTNTTDSGTSPESTCGWPAAADIVATSSFTTTGSSVSIATRRNPTSEIGSSWNRTPRSIVYAKWTMFALGSRMPISTTWASKISWIRSPTRSYIACMSSRSARPRCTSLTKASSALRCRVSSIARARLSAEPIWLATNVMSSLSCSVWWTSSR